MRLRNGHDKKATRGCPCGYFGDLRHGFRCAPLEVERYRSRVSGPLLDRIDIHLEVPAVVCRDLSPWVTTSRARLFARTSKVRA